MIVKQKFLKFSKIKKQEFIVQQQNIYENNECVVHYFMDNLSFMISATEIKN